VHAVTVQDRPQGQNIDIRPLTAQKTITKDQVVDKIQSNIKKNNFDYAIRLARLYLKQFKSIDSNIKICPFFCKEMVKLSYEAAFKSQRVQFLKDSYAVFVLAAENLTDAERIDLTANTMNSFEELYKLGHFNLVIKQLSNFDEPGHQKSDAPKILSKNFFMIKMFVARSNLIIGNISSAKKIFLSVKESLKNQPEHVKFAYYSFITDLYIFSGDFKLAGESILSAESILNLNSDIKAQSAGWLHLSKANMLRGQGDYSAALVNVDVAINLGISIKNARIQAWSMNTKGIILKMLGKEKEGRALIMAGQNLFLKATDQAKSESDYMFSFETAATFALAGDKLGFSNAIQKIKKYPNDYSVYYNSILNAYKTLGIDKKPKAAKVEIKEACEKLGPSNPACRDINALINQKIKAT
jgi:hypothetical protein